MLTYVHIISETPDDVRKRAKMVTSIVSSASIVERGGKKGIKFVAKGRAATEKVYYDVLLELYPKKVKSKEIGDEYSKVGDHTECFMHCQCPYFLYNCKWVLWKNGSSDIKIEPKCDNAAPHITNPQMIPYPCKHLFSLMPKALKALQKISID